jgi:ribonuclease H / adenosylcobalamin/alpha-ribazole phosphatase
MMGAPQRRRPPRRKGRANSDAERRALAKAHARSVRPIRAAPPHYAVLHADGGARGASGAAAIGYVIDDEFGVRLAQHAAAIGIATASVAEYRALLTGLERADELGLSQVVARCDSRLLIAHLRGDQHVRSPGLLALGAEILDASMRIGTVIFDWIPADANGAAHELVARVLDTGYR